MMLTVIALVFIAALLVVNALLIGRRGTAVLPVIAVLLVTACIIWYMLPSLLGDSFDQWTYAHQIVGFYGGPALALTALLVTIAGMMNASHR